MTQAVRSRLRDESRAARRRKLPRTWFPRLRETSIGMEYLQLCKTITYQFGVHQFWQFWRYCIYCYLSWYCTCFTYLDIAISPCATLICIYFAILDIVVCLPKALLIC